MGGLKGGRHGRYGRWVDSYKGCTALAVHHLALRGEPVLSPQRSMRRWAYYIVAFELSRCTRERSCCGPRIYCIIAYRNLISQNFLHRKKT
jgi:hypothetical protein